MTGIDRRSDQFDHYLTARWQLYTTFGPVLARSIVEHAPWPLHRRR